MDHTLGLAGIFMVGLITTLIGLIRPNLLPVLLSAYILRAGTAISHHYFFPLPDSQADAIKFERQAWNWAQDGLIEAFSHFPGMDASFYSWLISLCYSILGRSELFIQSIGVLAGVMCVYLCWHIGKELWGHKVAQKVAWVTSLFPSLILYSALTLREVYVVFFFLLGLSLAMKSFQNRGTKYTLSACLFFGITSLFHGGMFLALVGFIGVVMYRMGKKAYTWYFSTRLNGKALFGLFIITGLLVIYILTDFSVHKLGTFDQMLNLERWVQKIQDRNTGIAKYPEWTQPQNATDLFWALPLRVFYFLFSPFPWDIRTISHYIGFFDALIYLSLWRLIWKNRKFIYNNSHAKYLFLILIPLIVAFSVGTANFGSGLRHRAKFACVFILLAGAKIPRLALNNKNKR